METMKKLPVILFVVVVLLMVGFSPATAQTAEQPARVEPEVSLVLTELENLRLNVIVKDLLLAQQRIQNLQRNFNSVLAVVRKDHNAPEDKFLFDPNTMRFIRIPEKPEVKEE
jgi:hypothetical protein